MAFTVRTFPDESAIAAVVGGTVTTFPDEKALSDGIAAATSVDFVVDKGLHFTLFDSTTLVNIQFILGKEAQFTLVDGTP